MSGQAGGISDVTKIDHENPESFLIGSFRQPTVRDKGSARVHDLGYS